MKGHAYIETIVAVLVGVMFGSYGLASGLIAGILYLVGYKLLHHRWPVGDTWQSHLNRCALMLGYPAMALMVFAILASIPALILK